MNKKRHNKIKKSITKAEVAFLLLAAIVVIAAGINYSILKNEHVALDREMDKVTQEVKLLEAETQSELVEINRKINRFAIKSELRELNSVMRERPDFVVERVSSMAKPIAHQDTKDEVNAKQYREAGSLTEMQN